MADLQKLKAVVLADGTIDTEEVDLICRELYADSKIDQEVVDFLIGLRNDAYWVCPTFERLCFDFAKYHLLADGSLDAEKAAWLRSMLFADRKISEREKRFLRELRDQAQHVSHEFQELYDDCLQGGQADAT